MRRAAGHVHGRRRPVVTVSPRQSAKDVPQQVEVEGPIRGTEALPALPAVHCSQYPQRVDDLLPRR
eukprot:1360279-Prymnesium_polylepis.1